MAEQGASRGAILTLYSLALSLPYLLDMLPLCLPPRCSNCRSRSRPCRRLTAPGPGSGTGSGSGSGCGVRFGFGLGFGFGVGFGSGLAPPSRRADRSSLSLSCRPSCRPSCSTSCRTSSCPCPSPCPLVREAGRGVGMQVRSRCQRVACSVWGGLGTQPGRSQGDINCLTSLPCTSRVTANADADQEQGAAR